jgi:hypothetical protein
MPLSTFLNGRPPTVMRGLQWLALSDTAIVQSPTAVSDSGGGATTTWNPAGTFACRIDVLGAGGREGRVTGGQIDERSTHVVTVPLGSTVSASDRVAITGRGTFEVTAVRQVTSEFDTTFEVIQIS